MQVHDSEEFTLFPLFPCSTCGTLADVRGRSLQCTACPPTTGPTTELMQQIVAIVRPQSEERTPEEAQEIIDTFEDWMMDAEVLGDLPDNVYEYITDRLLTLAERVQTLTDEPRGTASSFMDYVLNTPLPALMDNDGEELPEPVWPKGQNPGSVASALASLPSKEDDDSEDEEHEFDAAVIMGTGEFTAIHPRLNKRAFADLCKFKEEPMEDTEVLAKKRRTKSASPRPPSPDIGDRQVLAELRRTLETQKSISAEFETGTPLEFVQRLKEGISEEQYDGVRRAVISMQHGCGMGVIYATGLGKTLIMLLVAWAAHQMGKTFLIIAPAHLTQQIGAEVEKWKHLGLEKAVFEGKIISTSVVAKHAHPDVVCWDEAHIGVNGKVMPPWIDAAPKMMVFPFTATPGANGSADFWKLMAGPAQLSPGVPDALEKIFSPKAIASSKQLKIAARRFSYDRSWALYRGKSRDFVKSCGGVITTVNVVFHRTPAQRAMESIIKSRLGEMVQHYPTNLTTVSAKAMQKTWLGDVDGQKGTKYDAVIKECAGVDTSGEGPGPVVEFINRLTKIYPSILIICDAKIGVSYIATEMEASGVAPERIVKITGDMNAGARNETLRRAYSSWGDGKYIIATNCLGTGVDSLQGEWKKTDGTKVWHQRLSKLVTIGTKWNRGPLDQFEGRISRPGQQEKVVRLHLTMDCDHRKETEAMTTKKASAVSAITGAIPTSVPVDTLSLPAALRKTVLHMRKLTSSVSAVQTLPDMSTAAPSDSTDVKTIMATLASHI